MSEVQKLSIALTSEQVNALKAAVATGEYATTSEILREAVRDWQHKRGMRSEDVERLRLLWDEGKASGKPSPIDFEKAKSEAKGHVLKAKRARVRVR